MEVSIHVLGQSHWLVQMKEEEAHISITRVAGGEPAHTQAIREELELEYTGWY
jgi:hypothetical protein